MPPPSSLTLPRATTFLLFLPPRRRQAGPHCCAQGGRDGRSVAGGAREGQGAGAAARGRVPPLPQGGCAAMPSFTLNALFQSLSCCGCLASWKRALVSLAAIWQAATEYWHKCSTSSAFYQALPHPFLAGHARRDCGARSGQRAGDGVPLRQGRCFSLAIRMT